MSTSVATPVVGQVSTTFAPVAPVPTTASEVERIRTEHPELIGVGGWLLWFCIVTTVIAPIINVVTLLSDSSAYSVIDLALVAYMIITGVNLWRLTGRALRLTKVLLAIQFWLGIVLIIIQIASSNTESTSGTSSSDTAGFRMLVTSTIWWFYFKRSKRVKATFGKTI
jgi:low temperature requirement protein LtrA